MTAPCRNASCRARRDDQITVGDCSLNRRVDVYANICPVDAKSDVLEHLKLISARSAKLVRFKGYSIEVGDTANVLVFDCREPETAVAECIVPMYDFKRGRQTFTCAPVEIHVPQ